MDNMLVNVDIQKLLSKISEGIQYCPICLRTEQETRLVEPRFLLAYTNALNIKLFTNKKVAPKMVCYMCEAASAKALKLHQALIDSLTIQKFIQKICISVNEKKPNYQRTCRDFDKWNVRVKKFRQSMSLKATEILVVDSIRIQFADKQFSADPLPTLKEQNTTYKLPNWTPDMETVILDDEDDPLNVPGSEKPGYKATDPDIELIPTLVPLDQILESKYKGMFTATFIPMQNNLLVKQPFQDNFLLHPIVLGKGNELLIPTLSLKLEDGKLIRVKNVNNLLRPPQIVINQGVISQNDEELAVLMRNPVNNGDDKVTYIVHNNKQTIDSLDLETIIKHALENKNSEIKILPHSAVKRKVTGMPVTSVTAGYSATSKVLVTNNEPPPLAVISNVTSTKTDEICKSDRIDWEDKIPMDVISFMDAVDPASKIEIEVPPFQEPETLIVPDIVPVSNKKLKPEIKHEPEIIDLC